MPTDSVKQENAAPAAASIGRPADPLLRRRLMLFGVVAVVICALFASPLSKWVSVAFAQERNSYLLLVPCIAAYLIFTRRPRPEGPAQISILPAAIVAAVGATALLAASRVNVGDQLSLRILSLLCFLASAAFLLIGARLMRQVMFPIVFLLFTIPMPATFEDYIEIFLQHGSAEAAYLMLAISGVPMVRDGLEFTFPNIAIRVAQECSGYNSSFALFLVSSLAAYLFLEKKWTKTALIIAVIPLALLRNGFRVTTLSLLCVYDDPKWIDSPLHHKGGPIFFALSMIPFLALLFWLRKMDSKHINQKNSLNA